MKQFSNNVAVIVEACQKVSTRLRRDFGEIENLQNSPNGANSFVQRAIERTKDFILKSLQFARPKYSIFADNQKEIQGSDIAHSFLIQTISGVNSFLHGLNGFRILISLEEQKKIITSLIFDPITDANFVAEIGKGAFFYSPYRSQRLRVSRRDANFFFGTNCENNENFQYKSDAVAELITGVCSGKFDAIVLSDLTKLEEKTAEIFISESGGKFEKIGEKIILSSMSALHTVKNEIF